MAVIRINDLKVRALIGANSWERVNKQELNISVTFEYDASKPAVSDKLSDALDYETLANSLIKLSERSKYVLLEKLAQKLLAEIMADKRVNSAYIRLDKPQALAQARCVSLELSAER